MRRLLVLCVALVLLALARANGPLLECRFAKDCAVRFLGATGVSVHSETEQGQHMEVRRRPLNSRDWRAIIQPELTSEASESCVMLKYRLTASVKNPDVRLNLRTNGQREKKHYLPVTGSQIALAYVPLRSRSVSLRLRGSWPHPDFLLQLFSLRVMPVSCPAEVSSCKQGQWAYVPNVTTCASSTLPLTPSTGSSRTTYMYVFSRKSTSDNVLSSSKAENTEALEKIGETTRGDRSLKAVKSSIGVGKTNATEKRVFDIDKTNSVCCSTGNNTNVRRTSTGAATHIEPNVLIEVSIGSVVDNASVDDLLPLSDPKISFSRGTPFSLSMSQLSIIISFSVLLLLLLALVVVCFKRSERSKPRGRRPLSSITESTTESAVTFISSSTEPQMSTSAEYEQSMKSPFDDDVFAPSQLNNSFRTTSPVEHSYRRPLLASCVESNLDRLSPVWTHPRGLLSWLPSSALAPDGHRNQFLPSRDPDGTTHLFRLSAARVSEV